MQSISKKRATGIIAAATLGLVALQAGAADITRVTASSNPDQQQVAVNTADLNLASLEGQETLLRRVSSAARTICGPEDIRSAGGLRAAQLNQLCYDTTMAQALEKLPAVQLAASY